MEIRIGPIPMIGHLGGLGPKHIRQGLASSFTINHLLVFHTTTNHTMPLIDNDNVWQSPLGQGMRLRRLDARNHQQDTHGNFGYKTNREVRWVVLVL